MEIPYGAQQLLGMKKNEKEFMILSSACPGDVNWYTSFLYQKGLRNNKNSGYSFVMLSMDMYSWLSCLYLLSK